MVLQTLLCSGIGFNFRQIYLYFVPKFEKHGKEARECGDDGVFEKPGGFGSFAEPTGAW